jgi:hypothetical protein
MPAGMIMVYKVKMSLSLSTTKVAFNTTMQQIFREQMAQAAGLTKADAGKVSLTFPEARRLLADLVVNVEIEVADKAASDKAVLGLTKDKINVLLAAAGLPTATSATTPTVETAMVKAVATTAIPTTTPKPNAAPSRAPAALRAFLTAMLVVIARA